ncbi:hypothetical protein R3P38DRAFT_2777262 [Favolaschia claudopus]
MPPRQIRPLLARDPLVNAEDIKQLAKTVRHLHRKSLPTDPWPKEQEGSGNVPRRLREWMSILRRLSSITSSKSLALQAIHNGLPTPPATQQSASAADVGLKPLIFAQARPEGTGNRTRQYNQNASPARPPTSPTPPKNSRSPYGMCCNHGKVALQQLEEPPEPLHSFFVGNVNNSTPARPKFTGFFGEQTSPRNASEPNPKKRMYQMAGRVKTGVKGLPPVVAQGVPVTDTKMNFINRSTGNC